jgi:S-formylglutathione hydrolase
VLRKAFFSMELARKELQSSIQIPLPVRHLSPFQPLNPNLTMQQGGLNIQGEDDAYDFGSGAGFYIDATLPPWSQNYKMESYITTELPKALFSSFAELDSSNVSITGHSMGGHGALTLFLKNPGMYKSVSAFAPIANPINCPWGEKAFKGYLGGDREAWKEHDATELLKKWKGPLDVLIDVVGSSELREKGQGTLIESRELVTTFINKSNCFPKTSPRPPKLRETIRD